MHIITLSESMWRTKMLNWYLAKQMTSCKYLYKAIEERNIYQTEVHAWHEISQLSLKRRFVVVNSIQKVKEDNHQLQPPTVVVGRLHNTTNHLCSHLKSDCLYFQFVYK